MKSATNHQPPITNHYVVAAFYKFAPVKFPAKLQAQLKAFMLKRDVKGTILVSPEGLNGTITGSRSAIDETLALLRAMKGFEDMEHKEAFTTKHEFERTKVKHKKELIGLGVPADPNQKVGEYIEPENWNEILKMGIPVIDTRNEYEVHLGTFEGAIDPKTKRFKDLPEWTKENLDPKKHKEIAMFCTGGIRCEKYSSYMLEQGFEKVYHLRGGVLKYLEVIPKEKSMWNGECYVFDERTAVGHGLEPSTEANRCPACGHSLLTRDCVHEKYIPGKRCGYCPD